MGQKVGGKRKSREGVNARVHRATNKTPRTQKPRERIWETTQDAREERCIRHLALRWEMLAIFSARTSGVGGDRRRFFRGDGVCCGEIRDSKLPIVYIAPSRFILFCLFKNLGRKELQFYRQKATLLNS